MALAAKGGLNLEQLGGIISTSNLASNLIQRKVPGIVAGNFQAAFPLKHMHKDLGLIVRTGNALGVSLPATGVMHQLFTAARAAGHAEEDFSAIYRLLAGMAGLNA
jgi:3-hydroxyisobutyrate dehydrogenase-like beta-hydroxyacid dehydrogenase